MAAHHTTISLTQKKQNAWRVETERMRNSSSEDLQSVVSCRVRANRSVVFSWHASRYCTCGHAVRGPRHGGDGCARSRCEQLHTLEDWFCRNNMPFTRERKFSISFSMDFIIFSNFGHRLQECYFGVDSKLQTWRRSRGKEHIYSNSHQLSLLVPSGISSHIFFFFGNFVK